MVVGTRLTSKGQVTIPKAVRDHLAIGPGDRVEFEIVRGRVEVRRVKNDDKLREALAAIQQRRPGDGMSTDEYMSLIRDEP